MEPALFISAMNAVRGWFGKLRDEQRALNAEERRAVKALYVAANETRLYINRLNKPFHLKEYVSGDNFERNIDREDELSRLWMDAHLELMPVNIELAERCLMKSGYWSSPDHWDDKQVKKANISLESMFKDAKALL